MKTNRIYALLLTLSVLTLSGCNTRGLLVIPTESHRHTTTVVTHAPPPHAPAHGHRHRHRHGHELRFDISFGAYLLINSPGLYFHNGHYIRRHDGGWQVTDHLKGTWKPAQQHHVPRKLKNAKRHKKQRHSNQRHDNIDNGHRRESRREHRRADHEADHRRESRKEHRRADREADHRRESRREHRRADSHNAGHETPRHGHRRHHHGHELSYDSGIGVYLIAKKPGFYFYNNHYYRQHRGKWQTSNKLNGKWRAASHDEVPRKLKAGKKFRKNKDRHDTHNKLQYKKKWQ